MTADLRATVAELSERVDRLERRQLRFQDDATSQLRRADAVAEDLVAAVDALRRRLEAVETTSQS
jgi:hypothetical protein